MGIHKKQSKTKQRKKKTKSEATKLFINIQFARQLVKSDTIL